MNNESKTFLERGNLAKWRRLALTSSKYGVAKHIVLVNGNPRLSAWTSRLLIWFGRRRDSNTTQSLLTELLDNLDATVADEAIRLFHLDSQPITNGVLRSLFDWLDIVQRTRPIQLSTAHFDRMLSQLCEFQRVELTLDHSHLLFCHLTACQTKAPDQFTQLVAEQSLAEGLAQLQAVSVRLREHLTRPDSPSFKRIFSVAIAQNPQLKVVGTSTAELRRRVACLARTELLGPQLITRQQLVAHVGQILGRLAADEDSVRVTPIAHQRRPDTKLIKLTQLSPDKLPD